MTKQEIIDLVMKAKPHDTAEALSNNIVYCIDKEQLADTLLAKFEQEKKEQAREIFRAVYYKLLGSGHSYLIKELADEYGVEL